jgi:WD40 repeat protein
VATDREDKPRPKKKEEGVRATPPPVGAKRGRSTARRRDDDDDDRPRRRRPSEAGSGGGGMMVVLLGGGALALLLLIACPVAGVLFFFMGAGPNADLAKAPQPAPAPVEKAFPPGQAKNDPIQNNDPPPNKKNDPPPKKNPKFDPPPKDVPPPVVFKWGVQPDPGPDMNRAPENPNGFQQFVGSPFFVYPTSPSPFVAVRHGQFGQEGWQIIDVRKFQQVGAINGKLDLVRDDHISLSPDGKFLAGPGKLQLKSTAVNVYSVTDGRLVQSIQLDTNLSSLLMVDFADNGHLITYKTRGITGFYEVFNLATGKPVKTFTVEGLLQRKNNLAFSPGRKYLAVAHKNQIDVFQIVSGSKVGQIQLPPGNGMCKALAFAPDGKELACLTEAFGSSSRLLSWKMTDGTPTIDHKFVKDVHTLVKNAFGYRGDIMEWVPDGSGWLLYGQLWVDYKSGAPVYTIDYPAGEFQYFPRRLIGKDHVVQSGGGFQKPMMNIAALPGAQIAAAVATARAGGGQAAALPGTRPADLATARMIPAPNGNVAWSVDSDPAPAPRAKLGVQPIQLRGKTPDILQILFSSGDVGQAVVVSATTPNPLAPTKVYRAERYDLADGKFLNACDLFSSDKAPKVFPPVKASIQADVSPDGSRLIVRQPDDPKRLDVWNLADGKHLVGWQPDFAGVDSFALVSADRALTCAGGKLILWKLPECQAVYVADGYRGAMQPSGTRKYVAASTGISLVIVECATGERKGQLGQLGGPAGPVGVFQAGAFSRDGKEFAASLGSTLARWSLANGSFTSSVQGSLGDRPMAFMGKYLMQGSSLFDWNLKTAPLWNYGAPGQGAHATGSPDGRHWFAATFQNTAILNVQTLPDAAAGALSAAVAAGNTQPVVTPGMAVQFQINSGSEKFRTKVQTSLKSILEGQGYKIGPGGLTIAVSAQESATGVTLDYELRKFGGGGKQRIKVAEKQVVCQYTVTDAQGTLLVKNNAVYKTPSSMTFEGDDYDRQLTESIWRSAEGFGSFVPLPTNMFRIQGQLQTLPKFGPLQGGG